MGLSSAGPLQPILVSDLFCVLYFVSLFCQTYFGGASSILVGQSTLRKVYTVAYLILLTREPENDEPAATVSLTGAPCALFLSL